MAPPVVPSPVTTTIRGVQREVLSEVVRITVELDQEVPFYQERIEGPSRLFFDLKGTRTVQSLTDATFRYNSDIVRHIRLGRHPNNTTRIVLDFENVSGDSSLGWLSSGIAETVTNDLRAVTLRVIDRVRVVEAAVRLGRDLNALRSALNIDLAVVGPEDEKIVLSSVHQAKGLEWRTVFVIWLADGRFPSQRALRVPGGIIKVEPSRVHEALPLLEGAIAPGEETQEIVIPGRAAGREEVAQGPSLWVPSPEISTTAESESVPRAEAEEPARETEVVQHVVRRGETLMSIARRYGVRVLDIKRENGLQSDTIKVGQRLRIPR